MSPLARHSRKDNQDDGHRSVVARGRGGGWQAGWGRLHEGQQEGSPW